MRHYLRWLALVVITAQPIPGQAQTAASRPTAASIIFNAAARGPLDPAGLADTTDSIPRKIRPTHWKTGALIGGLTLGTAFALIAPGFCALDDSAGSDCGGAPVAGFLVGGLLGSLTGALIGGQFPKGEKLFR